MPVEDCGGSESGLIEGISNWEFFLSFPCFPSLPFPPPLFFFLSLFEMGKDDPELPPKFWDSRPIMTPGTPVLCYAIDGTQSCLHARQAH